MIRADQAQCMNSGCERPGNFTIFSVCPKGHKRRAVACDSCTTILRHNKIDLYCAVCPKPRPAVTVIEAFGPFHPDPERHRKMTGKPLPSEACPDSLY